MTRIEADELLRRYASGERNFSGLEIDGSDELAGANLSDIDLGPREAKPPKTEK